MGEVASSFVSIVPSAKGFGGKLSSQIGGDVDKAGHDGGKRYGKGMSSGLVGMGKSIFGPLVAVGAAMMVGDFFKDAISEARESQKVGALTKNVIKTTGGAAKITAGQVEGLSMSISNKTGMDDEAIQSGANLLLTFKNVRNEVGKGSQIFDRATAAAADLSASGFGDVAGSSKMLGKALNDPISGITALGRAGVTFTAGQKKQIKGMVESGDVLGAQKIIMAEVESQVGGAAAASATAGEKLSTVWGNVKEQVGTALLPAIDTAMTAVSGFLTDVSASFEKGGLSQVFTDLGAKISAAWPGIQTQLGKWATAFWEWVKVATPPMLVKLGELLAVLGGWIWNTALPAIGRQLVAWGKAFVDWIGPQIVPMLTKLGELLGALGTWMLDTGLPLLVKKLGEWGKAYVDWIGPKIGPMLIELGKLLGRLVVWNLTVAVPKILETLAKWGKAYADWVVPATRGMLIELAKLKVRFDWWMLTEALPAIVRNLAGWARAFVSWIAGVIPTLPGKLTELLGTILIWAKTVPGKIRDGIGDLRTLLTDKGRDVVQGLIDGIKAMLPNVGAVMGLVTDKIAGFLPGSPVKEGPLRVLNRGYAGGQIVSMLAGGIDSQRSALEASMSSLVQVPRGGTLDFATSPQRASAVSGAGTGGNADLLAEVQGLRADIRALPRDYQMGQRQFVGAR